MYKLWNNRFFLKCDLVTYLVTDKVIHRRPPLLKSIMNSALLSEAVGKGPCKGRLTVEEGKGLGSTNSLIVHQRVFFINCKLFSYVLCLKLSRLK